LLEISQYVVFSKKLGPFEYQKCMLLVFSDSFVLTNYRIEKQALEAALSHKLVLEARLNRSTGDGKITPGYVIRDGCQMRKWLPFLTSLLLRQSV
jgi:hypothetical protein